MNLTDRIYLAVHLALTLLVCVLHERVEHWPVYVIWNLGSLAVIVFLARQHGRGARWEFAHDWLPAVFFITVFEEVSFLSLAIRGQWQNQHVIALEAAFVATQPMEWMHLRAREWLLEFLEFGYFAFYPLYPAVGGTLWAWRHRKGFVDGFRRLTDTLSIGYVICYTTYLLFPTQSPANRVGVQQIGSAQAGLFKHLVRGIQNHAGVHGNAFPSAHIMLAFVVLMFAYRFFPRVAPWILVPVLLMCAGAVYDGYHYATDVVTGALIGIGLGAAGSRAATRRPGTSDPRSRSS